MKTLAFGFITLLVILLIIVDTKEKSNHDDDITGTGGAA